MTSYRPRDVKHAGATAERTVTCDAMLRDRQSHEAIAARTGLSANYIANRAALVRHEERPQYSRDGSCPAFAYDDKFVALVRAHGGLPIINFETGRLVGADGSPWRELRP